jgi:ligand-binding SRPBCC domain-containing protein
MRAFAADETLFFTPAASTLPDALRVVYAYPNSYSVGITSLGYQLVWAFFATHAGVNVSRLFLDAHEPLPQARWRNTHGAARLCRLAQRCWQQLQLPAHACVSQP